MRMQLDASQVRHPCERGGIAGHDLFSGTAGWELQRDHLDPVGPRIRRALLVEELLAQSVRIPHQDVRTAAGAAERALGDGKVIVHEIELGVAGLREQDLARIRDRDLSAVDGQQFFVRLRGHYTGWRGFAPCGPPRRYCAGQVISCPSSRAARRGKYGSRSNSRAIRTASAWPDPTMCSAWA